MSIKTFVFFDIETTGTPSLEYCKTRITELSMVAVKREHLLDTRPGLSPRVQNKLTLCFNPRRLVQPASTEITGLCNDLLENEIPFNEQSFTLMNHFLEVLAEPICLVAHNGLSFDFPILKKQLECLSLKFTNEILCADSFFAFYDILKPKPKAADLIQTEIDKNYDKEEKPLEDNFLAMKKLNETTPKASASKPDVTPSKDLKSVMRKHPKARRRFPWSQGEKPKQSYKLTDIYERLLNRPAVDSHRAESDCIFLLESAVTIAEEFTKWTDSNHCSLILVAALWGCTNPFIRRGTKGLRNVKSNTVWGQAYAEVAYLLGNWKYVGPWLLNQVGSLVYLVTLQASDLSLAVPVSNSLAFVFTALTGWWLGEEALTHRSMFGVLLIISGTMLCYVDKS